MYDPRTVKTTDQWLHESAVHFFADTSIIAARHLPQTYAGLLVHRGSMTERLERCFGPPMAIKVLCTSTTGDRYARWVVMLDPRRRCIALAGVCLTVSVFSDDLRAAIRHGQQPLGRLLTQHGVAYESVPTSFLRFTPTTFTKNLFQMMEAQPIFGRRTELYVSSGEAGDIVEALPRYDLQYAFSGVCRHTSDDSLADSDLR